MVPDVPATITRYVLATIRVGLVAVGAGLGLLSLVTLVTIPPATGDGFVTGGAYLVWGMLTVVGFGVCGIGIALPVVVGMPDSLGFSTGQRTLLKGAVVAVAGGLVGFVAGVATNSFLAMVLALLVVVGGIAGVATGMLWRLGSALVARAGA